MAKPPTVKAVVLYAAQLRLEAEREIISDPYACPYRPTEAAARKLSNRLGPEAAIDHLRKRAAMHGRKVREEQAVAHKSLTVHKARQANHRTATQKRRDKMSPGVRIDAAVARLSVIAAPASSAIGQSVHGGTPDHAPAFTVDAADKARRLALICARQIEAIEDELRLRDVSQAAA